MGSNTIIAIVVGAILVIVGFSLWPVLNGASNSLYAYFRDSCDDGNGNRFLRAYMGDDRTQPLSPQNADTETYYPNLGFHGGKGVNITDDGNGRCETGIGSSTSNFASYGGDAGVRGRSTSGILRVADYNADLPVYVLANPSAARWDGSADIQVRLATATGYLLWKEINYPYTPFEAVAGASGDLYNEQGEQITSVAGGDVISGNYATNWVFCDGSSGETHSWDCRRTEDIATDPDGNKVTGINKYQPQNPVDPSLGGGSSVLPDPYRYAEVAPMLQRFSGINNLLLTILPVVSIAGFLGISGAKLYSYGKGTASIGSSISTSVFTLIGIVVAMVIAGPIMGSAVDANQVVVSGQYQVNGTFGNIIQLLFAMIPVVYIAGLVTLVGLQARTALMGYSDSGTN